MAPDGDDGIVVTFAKNIFGEELQSYFRPAIESTKSDPLLSVGATRQCWFHHLVAPGP